ncbi:hypothetical protein EDB85DRAFT_1886448 [Lactarius pseudohatsudake]|nr:hypothetical protein EDB85DRAFT_1886448 [Lactarius pseudohatsudake]
MTKSSTKSKVPTKKHNPKNGYSTAILKAAIKLKNSRKRPASESESEESEDEESSDDEPKVRCKKRAKQARATSAELDEIVNDSGPEVVEVEVVDGGDDGASDNEPDEERQSSAQGKKRGDDLEDRHRVKIPSQVGVKKGLTKDLLTIFSDHVVVKFMKNEGYETVKGWWCLPCKADTVLVKKYGKQKAFHIGGNSSCRAHIRKHYELYKQRCKDENIPENHYAVPQVIWKELQNLKANPKAKRQGKLDGPLGSMKGPSPHAQEFTQDGVLHAVARFVACGDQVLAVADKAVFRNCLTAMRPKAETIDLPSAHDVGKCIHNQCVDWLTELKGKIRTKPSRFIKNDLAKAFPGLFWTWGKTWGAKQRSGTK